MKRAFTLIELVIAAAVIGIVAAVALPMYQSYTLSAKEAAAKDTLRILRNVIEIYAIQHSGLPPGYLDGDPKAGPSNEAFIDQLVHSEVVVEEGKEDNKIRRTGLASFPVNPFNGQNTVHMIADEQEFPIKPVEPDFFGWVYKPATKNIRVNSDGIDKSDVRYFDY
jgi:prepilin-type N-terminal cleavage/methylation domain-containing protein